MSDFLGMDEYKKNKFLMFVIDEMANQIDRGEGEKVIRLTLGKSELPVHERIIQEMHRALDDFGKNSLVYPTGLPELKSALKNYYSNTYNVDVNMDNIIISSGTSTIFRNLFQIILNRDDEVLIPYPYYSLYKFCALLCGAKIKYYDILTSSGEGKIDMESFESSFSEKTKIVIINSPGNPLGNVISEDEVREIDAISNGQAAIISDEIYSNSYFDESPRSILQMNGLVSPVIVTNAFSKTYRMYSRRVGYCIVPEKLVIPLTVIQHHTLLTVDPVVQYGAIEALKLQEEVVRLVDLYRNRRDYINESFSDVTEVNVINSNGGFYVTIDCTKYMERNGISSSFELCKRILKEVNVAAVPGEDFGLPQTIRLSFSSAFFKEGVDRLVKFFRRGYNEKHVVV